MPVRAVEYDEIAPRVEAALRKHLPENTTIDTNRGYQGRVHSTVISTQFNGLSEKQKQEIVWRALREELGDDVQDVALVLAYGSDEYP